MKARSLSERLSPAHSIAADLDQVLGDPMDDQAGAFSYRSIVDAEEADRLPKGAIETLLNWGFSQYLVPHSLGGRLTGLEDLLLLTRTVSRRDMTCAVTFGSTLLAVNPVWLWGDFRQRKIVADGILDGDLACFGVSEADHGSDMLGCETSVVAGDGLLLLTGTKWPVGNATRGRFVTAYARYGPKSFSLILVDKNELSPDEWEALPYVKTLGLRGHDLSGIVFKAAVIPAANVIGKPGLGLVQTLKALQITRTAIAALSLGVIDAVLRIGMDYTRQRVLYGAEVYEIPVIRDELLKAHVDLLIAECTAVPAARSMAMAPGRLSLWSSVVKYFIPTLGDEVVAAVGRVLAARGYLREGIAHGAFQKLQRDHAIASVFEGTTHVNLANIAAQLPSTLSYQPQWTNGVYPDRAPLERLFSWTSATPPSTFDGRSLQLSNEGRDEITQELPQTIQAVLAAARRHAPDRVRADLIALTSQIERMHTCLIDIVRAKPDDTMSAAALERARRHCEIHAMASCMLTWLHNRAEFGGAFSRGEWLVLCLQRLLQRSAPDRSLSAEHITSLEQTILSDRSAGRWFCLLGLADERGACYDDWEQ